MKRRGAIVSMAALALAPFASIAQQRVWRIGLLETTAMSANTGNLEAFRKGMQEHAYAEGKHYLIDYRSADGRNERFTELAAELVRAKPDLIVTRGTPATLAAQKATTSIPIVTTTNSDPLLYAKSLARPGGNITGLVAMNSELQGKRLQLLKEVLPALKKFASFQIVANPAFASALAELESKARQTGLQLVLIDIRSKEDFAPAFERAVKERAGAVESGLDSLVSSNGGMIAELALKHRLPTLLQAGEIVAKGGLLSYGVNYPDQYRRAASFVDRILKGANPAVLPMEQPTKFELAINLKTAKALGITIPQSVLLRADKVIE